MSRFERRISNIQLCFWGETTCQCRRLKYIERSHDPSLKFFVLEYVDKWVDATVGELQNQADLVQSATPVDRINAQPAYQIQHLFQTTGQRKQYDHN